MDEPEKAARFERWFGAEGFEHAARVSVIAAGEEVSDASRSTTRSLKSDEQNAAIDAMRAAFFAALDGEGAR